MTLMDYRVRVIRDEHGLLTLKDAWERLLSRSNATIFASHPWTLAWWHAFGADKQLYILTATNPSGEVCGIAPLMLDRLGPLRKLEIIGTGLGDAGDFLLDPDHAPPVATALFAHLRRLRREWDLIDLDEVPPYSPLSQWLQSGKPLGQHIIRLPRTDAPYVSLPPTWEEYIATLQRKPRQHLESFAKRVVKEENIEYRCVTSEHEAREAVDRFYALHRARWETKSDDLNAEHMAPAFLPFLEELCTRAAASNYLRISELFIGSTIISSWISFQVNARLNGYMTGFDPAYSKVRPGKLLHRFVVRQALEEHATELDFGRGDEEYKFEMGATHRHNARFILANNTPRSLLALSAMKLRQQARTLIHNLRTPATTDQQPIISKEKE